MSRDGILLLGGAGFIGRALIRRLATQSRPLHVVCRAPLVGLEPSVTVHVGDLGDTALLQKLQSVCSTVVHLASSTTPGASARRPLRELENLKPFLQLLEILQDWQDTQLIFLSSGGTVYGNPTQNPVAENAPLAPLSYHGACKVAMESFLQSFRTAGHAVTILRPANAYGPEQNLNQGFGFVRTALQHMLQGSTLEIWGDGESVRDFVYVDDVADAISAAIGAPMGSAVYNIGSGKAHSLNRVLEIAQQVCGTTLQIAHRPARAMDVRAVVLDMASIGTDLGWQPTISLEEGILRTWNWLKKL